MSRTRKQELKFEPEIHGSYYNSTTGVKTSDFRSDWSPAVTKLDQCTDDTAPGPPYRRVNALSIIHTHNPGYYRRGSSGRHYYSFNTDYSGYHWTSLGITNPSLSGDAWLQNNASMSALGATGWNKFKPAKPIADVGVMLGETRELPKAARDAVKTLRELATSPDYGIRNMSWFANQHLAMQFGWLPLMRDLEKCYKAIQNADSWMSRVRKYNGKWEHRGGVVAKGEKTYTSGTAYMFPMPNVYSQPPEGLTPGTILVTEGYKIWFSAWFKYYIADFESAESQLRLKARIWGLHNTPLIVWNLLPWSWLVDWFSNLGDNIDNLVPIDGLVAKMPCVMRHCWTKWQVATQQRYRAAKGSSSYVTHYAENFKLYETKSRSLASPFGFGLTLDTLSLRQWSILAALGITRVQPGSPYLKYR